jgi:Putative amidoligase enzyme
MNTQEILNSEITKTEKIKRLLELGLTRSQVAQLTGGNYGFVQNVFAKYFPDQVNVKTFRFTPFNRKFGIEIEAHGVGKAIIVRKLRAAGINVEIESYNHTTAGYWKIVTDGSLNGENAWEIVSPILQGLEGLNEVEKVCQVLGENGVKINKSCGLHIHFDAQNMTANHLKNLVINYGNFESVIDSFLPESRRGNNNTYCKSVRSLEAQISSATTIRKMAEAIGSRYYKLNLQSYLRHQTIEFRQHSGTVEYTKISNWILFLHNLVEYSATKRISQTEGTMENLKKFNQPEVINYIITRQNQLAA